MFDRYLFAFFMNGSDADAEQVRFAVSDDASPRRWTVLAEGEPVLRSTVGEGGARDPFLVRDDRAGRFLVLATDLHAAVDGDWDRAVRRGSRSIVVWESDDLVTWSAPRLAEIAPPEAGNAWAPKAFWSTERGCWIVLFAAALYPADDDRSREAHQRVLVVETDDFHTFGPARPYLDPGHDVIDVTFLDMSDAVLRFSVDALTDDTDAKWRFVSQEHGSSIFGDDFLTVRRDLGRGVLMHAEGPAPFAALDDPGAYLLLDEFERRGYQLFRSDDPASGRWRHVADARLPEGARHGSVLPLTAREAERLRAGGAA